METIGDVSDDVHPRRVVGKPVVRGNCCGELRHVRVAGVLGEPGDGCNSIAIGQSQQKFVSAHVDRDDALGLGFVRVSFRREQTRAEKRQRDGDHGQERRRDLPQRAIARL